MPSLSPPVFFSTGEGLRYNVPDKKHLRKWLSEVARREGVLLKEVGIVICSDEFLLEMNKQYLNHDYYTDIITFNYSDNALHIQGELFISIDRIKENAVKFNVKIFDELKRVIVHGFLHLIGFDDQTNEEKKVMRRKEDEYLSIY